MTAPDTAAYRFSVAPMLDCTDRHFRVLMRQISQRALLYSEMVVAQALHHSRRRDKLLDFDAAEHPIALQVGGDDPDLLSDAARLAQDWGYDEINLNVGCPSQKVQAGNFGACLMAEPDLVARCVEAMTTASSLPVTVKHRIGIDNLDSDDLLTAFVDRVAAAGASRFAVHARKAWLEGLDPKQNRTVPPLQHERVAALKQRRKRMRAAGRWLGLVQRGQHRVRTGGVDAQLHPWRDCHAAAARAPTTARAAGRELVGRQHGAKDG